MSASKSARARDTSARDDVAVVDSSIRRARRNDLLASLAPFVLLLLLWETIGRAEVLDPRFFPPVSSIVVAFGASLTEGTILSDLWITLQRLTIAFVIAAVSGIALGVAMGLSRTVDLLAIPFVDTLYPVPKVALLPIAILYLGIGETSVILVTFLTAFLQIAITVSAAARGLDPALVEAGHNFGATGPRFVTRVALPALMPTIFSALRIGLGLCLILLVIVEFLASRTGIGAYVARSWQILAVDGLYAGLVLTGLLGHLINVGFRLLERAVVPWRDETRTIGRA